MTKQELLSHLKRLDACDEAIEWVESTGRMSAQCTWDTCTRADWLLWLAGRAGIERKVLVLAACACARAALVHVLTSEDRPRRAIEAAEGWARGEVPTDEVRMAANAAYDYAAYADDAYYAYYAARCAAYAAYYAARCAAHAADYASARAAATAATAADSAAYAAYAATNASAAYASEAANASAHREMSDVVRQHITWDMVAAGLES